MSMTGAIVNALAIVAGGAVGLLFRRGIPERVSKTVTVGLGLCVLYIGISGAMECRSILIVIVSMTLGAAVGALLKKRGISPPFSPQCSKPDSVPAHCRSCSR